AGNHSISTGASAGQLNISGTFGRVAGASVIFTKTGGNINFASSGLANDASGILGGWGIIGGDWATLSSSNVAAYTSYTVIGTSGAIASSATTNIRITSNGGTATLSAAGTTD